MIRTFPEGKIVGAETYFFTIMNKEKYDPSLIPGAWQAFFAKYPDSLLPKHSVFYGAVEPNNSMDLPMRYVAGILVDNSIATPDGFAEIEFPAGDYFCFTHHGPISGLGDSYPIAYGVEFPKAGREMRNAPHLEIYDSEKDPMDPEYQLVIAIPIK